MITLDDIAIGVNVDLTDAERKLSDLPKTVQRQWEDVSKFLSSGQAIEGVAGQRMLQAYKHIHEIIEQVGEKGFFSPRMKRDFDKNVSDLNRGYKRFFDEQKRIAKESIVELEQAQKRYYEVFDRYQRLMPDEKRTAAGEQLKQEMLSRGRIFDRLHEQVHGPDERRREMLRALQDMQDVASLVPVRPEEKPPPEQKFHFGNGITGNFLRGLLGIGAIGGIGFYAAARVRQEFSAELQRGMEEADFSQRLRPRDMSYEAFRERITQLNPSFSPDENFRFLSQYTSLAGAGALFARGAEAADLTRRLGFSPDQGARYFGQAAQMGLTEQGQRRFAQLLADAIAEGRMKGREGEMWESLLQLSETVVSRSGQAPETGELAGLLARMAATGEPGLRGHFGASVLQRVDAAISSTQVLPSLPNIKEAAALLAFPNMGLADIQAILEKGVGDPRFAKIYQTALATFGGSHETEAMVAQAFNVPLSVRKQFDAVTRRGGSPQEMQGVLEEQGDRPEADVRQELAHLHQLEAEAVRKVIPAYRELLEAINAGADGLRGLHRWITEQTGSETTADVTVAGMVGAGAAGAVALGKRAFSWLFGARGGSAAEAAAAAAKVPYWQHLSPWRGIGGGLAGLATDFLFPRATAEPTDDMLSPEQLGVGLNKKIPETVLGPAIAAAAKKYNVPQAMIRAIIEQESSGGWNRKSPAGALGVMQVMPKTAGYYGVTPEQLLDPATNIDVGTRYFAEQREYFRRDDQALAAYHAGPQRVIDAVRKAWWTEGQYDNWKQYLPKERMTGKTTASYVEDVQAHYARLKSQERHEAMRLEGNIDLHVNLHHPDGTTTVMHKQVPASSLNLDYRAHRGGSERHAPTTSALVGQ